MTFNNKATGVDDAHGQTETSLHQLLQSAQWMTVILTAQKLIEDNTHWYTMTQNTFKTLHQLTTKLELERGRVEASNILTSDNASFIHRMLTTLARIETVLRLQVTMSTAFTADNTVQKPCLGDEIIRQLKEYRNPTVPIPTMTTRSRTTKLRCTVQKCSGLTSNKVGCDNIAKPHILKSAAGKLNTCDKEAKKKPTRNQQSAKR